jgi:hypothetical protein
MPKRLQKEEATATETYAKFVADPFETGYGHTVGNSLRRVLLSSLEGAAITSIKVDGAVHEFATCRRGRRRHRHRPEPEEGQVQGPTAIRASSSPSTRKAPSPPATSS